ncbi:hypothetical protein HAX54_046453 [Datura stramonium]|uniref:Uncharacterized protein n=1 Tax=Datura stramonium TaxID=4076 RepID=A0ABS8WH28_DATST|nr:hypothetical protein [Datura stramonium]
MFLKVKGFVPQQMNAIVSTVYLSSSNHHNILNAAVLTIYGRLFYLAYNRPHYLLQVIFEKLATPIVQKFAECWDLEDRIKKLKEVLPLVQAILEDAEEQQTVDKAVKIWVSKLKDAANRAEDLLEEFVYKSNLITYGVNITNMRNVLDTLQKAAIEGLKLNLKERKVGDRLSKRRETGSFVMSSEVFGRGEERRKIVEQLLTSSTSEGGSIPPVISIVGVPGIGKTTLAQLAYNDEEVREHFDLRIWVFVSDEFNVKNILKAAIESTTARKCELSELDALQSQLWNILHRKRYLLVLDDVWSDDQEDWDMIRPLFSAGTDGSKILITSRRVKVAFMMDTPKLIHSTKRLTEEDTWALFKRYALHDVKESDCQNLLSIGKEISKKFLGVPLAAKTIGSMMRFKREEKEWLHVKNSSIWNLKSFKKGIVPVLLLSFLHLPSNIKHCFSFCSTFPKSYQIKKENLINMWIAHGLVFPDEEGKQLEDIAAEYFDELLWMSFFEKVNESCDGYLTTYKMYDWFYSLARHLTTNEATILASRTISNDLTNTRHASIVSDYRSSMIPKSLCQAKYLRTLLVFSVGKMNEVPSNIFSSFIHLRVLDLSGCNIDLPNSIGELRSLKYLDLSNTEFQELPSSISSFHSLMTLNLLGCHNLQRLPALGHITSLRHLIIDGCEALTQMPSQIEQLVHLQTLPIFIVSFPRRNMVPVRGTVPALRKKKVWKSNISNLQLLNLRGQLKIKHLEYVTDAEDAEAAKLKNKEHLESLGLCWGSDGADLIMNPALTGLKQRKVQIQGSSQEPQTGAVLRDQILAGEVLAYLQPHDNLENLFIVGYPGLRFPHWMLPRVTKVVLINCRGCLHVPSLGHLPSLRILHMEGMHIVRCISQEFYGDNSTMLFPSLHELLLKDFPLLEEWSTLDGGEMFPNLRKLTLKKCPRLFSVPLIPTIQELKLQGCNPTILGCFKELTLLSTLVIEEFGELLSLPGKLLGKNHLLKCLKISSCPNLQCLPPDLVSLTSLKSLTLRWCWELFSLPKDFQNLTSLESLEISDCHSLFSLPEVKGGLRSLRALSVENCSNLASINIGLQHLTALEHLTIMYCPSLSALPDGMGHLLSLKSLTILSCPLIEFLPEELKYVKALRCLEIRSCPRLSALPEWFENLSSLKSLALSDCPNIRSLPVAFRGLRSLQHLSIQDCPHLQIRCKQDGGIDWWKITHVPYQHIFSSQLSRSSEAASSSSSN